MKARRDEISSKRDGDQYMIRFPKGMRARLAELGAVNGRSISAEIVDAVAKHLSSPDRLSDLERRVRALEERNI